MSDHPPCHYLPETDSEDRPHVLVELCWCGPTWDIGNDGNIEAVRHADNMHVLPVGDLVGHDEESSLCVCGPSVQSVTRSDGSIGRLVTHHSLDGRELREPS